MIDQEALLATPPFEWDQSRKESFYRNALIELTEHHRKNCPEYARLLNLFGWNPEKTASSADIPFFPVRLFKEFNLRTVPENEIIKTMTSSGTTGQRVSKIYLDRTTAALQTKVLAKITGDFLGNKRLPMLIIDSPATVKNRLSFSARGAGILGFSMLGRKPVFALDDEMNLNLPAIEAFTAEYASGDLFLFGFTSIVWRCFYQALAERGITLPLNRGILIHGGGWKTLAAESVTNDVFKESLHRQCGLSRIYNYYGMAEQTGSIFMECEAGRLHASIFSDILIRRADDFSVAKIGERGLIQLVSLLPASYPGHSLLTEDEGALIGVDDCPCGRCGKTFTIYGRIKNAEIRGCSDTFRR